MDEYNRLSSEDEKRLFLLSEMAKHNMQLAAAAKDARVIEPIGTKNNSTPFLLLSFFRHFLPVAIRLRISGCRHSLPHLNCKL